MSPRDLSKCFHTMNICNSNVIKSSMRSMFISSTLCRNTDSPTPHRRDLIGPPHPVSNLRPVKFHIPQNESKYEREFRVRRGEVQHWNETFWTKHNTNFNKERDVFTKSTSTESSTLSADEMSVFYKEFLDKNWKLHLNYNFEWYKKNISLAILASKVSIYKLFNRN